MATPERFAADFLTAAETGWKDVHSPEYDADPRSARIAHALRAAGVEQAFVLGAGSFGVAAAMQDGRVVKLTTDETEVAAGSVLKDRNLAHVAHVYGAWFVRGVHADRWDLGTKGRVGMLITERVSPLDYRVDADGAGFGQGAEVTRVWKEVRRQFGASPESLAEMTHAESRKILRLASKTLEARLRDLADEQRDPIARAVADALRELRTHRVYSIDVHAGNIGYSHQDGVFKVFDIGSSSSPEGHKPPELPHASGMPRGGMVEEGTSVEEIGDQDDAPLAWTTADLRPGVDYMPEMDRNGHELQPGDVVDLETDEGRLRGRVVVSDEPYDIEVPNGPRMLMVDTGSAGWWRANSATWAGEATNGAAEDRKRRKTLRVDKLIVGREAMAQALWDVGAGRVSRTKAPLDVWYKPDCAGQPVDGYLLTDGHHRLVELLMRGPAESFTWSEVEVRQVGSGYNDYWRTPAPEERFVFTETRYGGLEALADEDILATDTAKLVARDPVGAAEDVIKLDRDAVYRGAERVVEAYARVLKRVPFDKGAEAVRTWFKVEASMVEGEPTVEGASMTPFYDYPGDLKDVRGNEIEVRVMRLLVLREQNYGLIIDAFTQAVKRGRAANIWIRINLGSPEIEKLRDQPELFVPRFASIFLHELTHVRDVIKMVDVFQPKDDRVAYYNSPHERRAYTRQIVEEVVIQARFNRDVRRAPNNEALIETALANSRHWLQVEPYLTEENKRLVLQAVYRNLERENLLKRPGSMRLPRTRRSVAAEALPPGVRTERGGPRMPPLDVTEKQIKQIISGKYVGFLLVRARDFLALTLENFDNDVLEAELTGKYGGRAIATIEQYNAGLPEFGPPVWPPLLNVELRREDEKVAKVTGHEGRHRAFALYFQNEDAMIWVAFRLDAPNRVYIPAGYAEHYYSPGYIKDPVTLADIPLEIEAQFNRRVVKLERFDEMDPYKQDENGAREAARTATVPFPVKFLSMIPGDAATTTEPLDVQVYNDGDVVVMRGDVAKKDADGLVAVRIVETYLPAEVWDWYYGQIMAGRSPSEINPEHYELQYVYDEAMVKVPQRASVAESTKRSVIRETDGRIGRKDCRHIQDWLYDYLKTEVDPYDFNFAVKDWIEQEGITDDGTPYAEPTDVMPEDLSQEQLKTFTNWLKKSGELELYKREMPFESPAYLTLHARSKLPAGSWFVHFTKESFEYFSQGATLDGLHLSTWKKHKDLADCTKNLSDTQGLAEVVFGFAFSADGMSGSDLFNASRKYGNNAILFQCDCAVEAYHDGDEENQAIFPVCSEYNVTPIIWFTNGEVAIEDANGNEIEFKMLDALIEYLETKIKPKKRRRTRAQEAPRSDTESTPLPFALVRHGHDVVPTLLVDNDAGEMVGVDVQGRLLSFGTEDVVGLVNAEPAAVYYGVRVEAQEEALPMAAEANEAKYGAAFEAGHTLSPTDVAALPIGSLLWWNGQALIVVPGGLAPVSILPERAADYRAPDGESPESFGGPFTLIATGSGKLPVQDTAQRKVMAWWDAGGAREEAGQKGVKKGDVLHTYPGLKVIKGGAFKVRPRGQRFQWTPEKPRGLTAFPEVKKVLLKQREGVPSLESIRMAAIFAGLTVHAGTEEAEETFGLVVAKYKSMHGSFPPVEHIQDILKRHLPSARAAMYETVLPWSTLVQDAMKRGLRDRELRRHIWVDLEGDQQVESIGLAKMSFAFMLMGQNLMCLDTWMLGAAFADKPFDPENPQDAAIRRRAVGDRISKQWPWSKAKSGRELALKRYEQVEDAILKGNPFHDPTSPIDLAQCQWESWQWALGGIPVTHRPWIEVTKEIIAQGDFPRPEVPF